MMFQLDAAFAAELIALILGTALLVVLTKWEVKSIFPKVVGVFAVVTSLLGMLCTAYYGYRYRAEGYFASPFMKMEKEGMKQDMMKEMMNQEMKEKCSMMEKMVGSETRPGAPGGAGSEQDQPKSGPDDHRSHH